MEKCSTGASKEPIPVECYCCAIIAYCCANWYEGQYRFGEQLAPRSCEPKRRSPDDNGESLKRRKSVKASQKASILSSDEEETDASEKAHTQH